MLHSRISEISSRPDRDARVLRGPRLLRDESTGETITVVERRADGVAGARGPASLFFSTDRGFIRLWDYPDDWDDMADADLMALSERPRRSRSA